MGQSHFIFHSCRRFAVTIVTGDWRARNQPLSSGVQTAESRFASPDREVSIFASRRDAGDQCALGPHRSHVPVPSEHIAIKAVAHSVSTLGAMQPAVFGEEMMKRRFLLPSICSATIFLIVATAFIKLSHADNSSVVEATIRKVTQGALQAIGHDRQPRAECPLKHTDVKAEVSGHLARVTVTQEFHNQFQEEIEAVYVFPLSQSAAVDDMTMIVEMIVSEGGRPRRIDVPVEMPEGMTYKGGFGANKTAQKATLSGDLSDLIEWSLPGIWRGMSWVTRIVIIILLIMSIVSIAVLIERHLGFMAARNQSREFVPKLTSFLESQKIDEAISLSDKYKKSHLAMVVKAGLQGFREHQLSSDISSEVIASSKRALQRATAIKIAEFGRGLSGLATIGSTAPFVGLFGTVFGIIDTFVGMGSASSAGISAVAGGLAEALGTTAFGFAVGVPAVWFFNYITSRVDNFSVEMENTSAELIDFFLKQRGTK
jgi:biopolymer transport protein ExbB/TolQ